ncbi:hypothetical protein DFH08DRAFT_825945 [Mycena albidolilacea]|uniref:Uncharacterized protein n=1 Tax=Mycena albidolilacea TaxID=1033008 RepID=A0AAD7E9L9_9AGAR|nr:hypothetical protein DFH08DRAFT_825945 [Mycena albidolilacea]
MRKGKFNTAQKAQLNTYLPEFIQKLDAGVRGLELTQWKQSTATKALASPPFADLDISIMPRTDWFKTIVRKFTNYFNNVYKRSHEEEPSASVLIKSNPLLRFTSILSGRQLFARESHNDIHKRSAQRITDTGVNEAVAYQVVLKEMWDGLSTEEKSDWDSQAEDETGDIELNQKEFSTNIHLALKSLCQGGLIGDAEMILFYGFRNLAVFMDIPNTTKPTLVAMIWRVPMAYHEPSLWTVYCPTLTRYSINSESIYNTLGPVFPTSASVIVDVNGVVNFPPVDVEKIPVAELRVLLEDYLKKCWGNMFHRTLGKANELPVPWDETASDPSKFYDNQKFTLPLGLKFPQTMNSVETLMLGEFFNSIRDSVPFHFTPDASRPETVPAPSNQQVERTPSLPPIPPLSTENGMSEQGKQQSGFNPTDPAETKAEQETADKVIPWLSFFMCRCPETTATNDPDGKQDHESEKELEIVPKKPRNETRKPASASEPAIRRSSRTTAPRQESTTQKTGKPTESRSAEGWVPLSDDEDNSN